MSPVRQDNIHTVGAVHDANDPLPDVYRILPVSVPFMVNSHRSHCHPSGRMLVPEFIDSEQWYQSFVDRVVGAIGREYLPVCRMADGEFIFCVGQQPPDIRLPWLSRMKILLHQRYTSWKTRGNFLAHTPGQYQSGQYTRQERENNLEPFGRQIKEISDKGILAPLLSYNEGPPFFQEHFFPAMGKWYAKHDIQLTLENCTAFYFLYAMLTGPRRHELVRDRNILVVNGAQGAKKEAIIQGLKREGAREVYWCGISSNRSLFDQIDVSPWVGKVDIAYVGAGIGKPGILLQMEPLGVPCIDVGYVFEIWADPKAGLTRPMCVSDEDLAKHQVQA